jgi:mono/diheme cytochrome c family protein
MKTNQEVRAFGARPITALAVLIAMLAVGSALLAGCGGGSTQQAGEEQAQTQTETGTTGDAATPEGSAMAGDVGAKVYSEKCALCHGAGGKGDGPGGAALNPKPRDHTDGGYMNGRTNEELLAIIKDGKGAMPAWGTTLSAEEMNAVLKHVRSLAVPAYSGPMPS